MFNAKIIYIIIFKLFGLAPLTLKNTIINDNKQNIWTKNHKESAKNFTITIQYSWIGCCYNILLIVITFGISFILLPQFYESSDNNILSQRIEIVLTIGGVLTVIVIWLCYCIQQSSMILVGNDLILFDNKMKQLSDTYKLKNKNYLLHFQFAIYIILGISMICIDFSIDEINISIISYIYFITIGLHIIQYSLCLGIIKKRFISMNNAMMNICNNYSEYQLRIFVKTTKFKDQTTIYDNIIILRRGHRLLTNICSRISNFYGTPILFSITYYSGVIVYYMYLVIGPFVDENVNTNYTTESLKALLPLALGVIAIISITVYANNVVDEMGLIIDGINKLLNVRLASREANWELEQFALEMLHRKVNFDACGIFLIDCTLLRSITSMTVTYLILLVQTT